MKNWLKWIMVSLVIMIAIPSHALAEAVEIVVEYADADVSEIRDTLVEDQDLPLEGGSEEDSLPLPKADTALEERETMGSKASSFPEECLPNYTCIPLDRTFRIKATTTWGLNIRNAPSTGTILDTLWYPITFKASCQTQEMIGGYYWLYGTASNGVTGWIAYNLNWIEDITPADTTPPVISNIIVSNITSNGYTVMCNVSDNVGVVSVKFPTWTEQNGQDDLIWHIGTIVGNTASYTVKTSDHKNQRNCVYITHIYAYDAAGNSTCQAYNGNGRVTVPDETPRFLSSTTIAVKENKSIVADNNTVSLNGCSFSSSNKKIATVSSSGVVKGIKAGYVIICVSKGGKGIASCGVTVKKAPSKVSLNVSKKTVYTGGNFQLKASIPSNSYTSSLTWSTSNSSVAEVSSLGVVTGKCTGTATITVKTSNGKKAKCKVTVKTDIALPSNLKLWVAGYGWMTEFKLKKDWSFSGDYNWGDKAASTFKGQFTDIRKQSNYVYKMNIGSFSQKRRKGSSSDAKVNELRKGDVCYLFLPGTPKWQLPDESRAIWLRYSYDDVPSILNTYLIFDETTGYMFSRE